MKKGVKHSQEALEKMRLAKLGKKRKPFSKETRLLMSEFHKGKKVSAETRKKLSLLHSGKPKPWRVGALNHFWKGGITPINQKIRQSLEYTLWRRAVFERDKFMCIFGGKEHGNKLQADHIKPFSYYPELRFAIDNGRTLCKDCHRKTDTYAGRSINYAKNK